MFLLMIYCKIDAKENMHFKNKDNTIDFLTIEIRKDIEKTEYFFIFKIT